MPVAQLWLTDLTEIQMLFLAEQIQNFKLPEKQAMRLILLSLDLKYVCLVKPNGDRSFSTTKDRILIFDEILKILKILRKEDSLKFWLSKDHSIEKILFPKQVEWAKTNTTNQPILLNNFLDLPAALSDPIRYRSAFRALQRICSLFPKCPPIPCDDLMESFVRDLALAESEELFTEQQGKLYLASIAVTGQSLTRKMANAPSSFGFHLLNHQDILNCTPNLGLAALLWISDLGEYLSTAHLSPVEIIWKRIQNTPYIAPLGDHSLSMVRFRLGANQDNKNELLPLYQRSPQQTYDLA